MGFTLTKAMWDGGCREEGQWSKMERKNWQHPLLCVWTGERWTGVSIQPSSISPEVNEKVLPALSVKVLTGDLSFGFHVDTQVVLLSAGGKHLQTGKEQGGEEVL